MIIPVFTRGVVMPWKPHKSGLLVCSLAQEERMVGLTPFMEFSQSCRLAGALPALGEQMLLSGKSSDTLLLNKV